MDALQSLVAAGLTPEQIVALGREAEARRNRLLQAGYSPLYVSSLSGPELFAVSSQATLPLVAGTEEMDRELQARIAAESALQARADAAAALLRLLLEQAQARAEAERSPYRFVDFLRNVSTLPQGEAAHVIQSLTGRQLYIEPKLPVETERERELWDRLLEYAKPQSPFVAESRGTLREDRPAYLPPGVTEQDIARVREAYARDPVAAQRFFEEAARNPEGVRKMFGAYAEGGELVADEPIVGMGLATGSPRFLLGEAGPEKLRITPMKWRRLRALGRLPVPTKMPRPIWRLPVPKMPRLVFPLPRVPLPSPVVPPPRPRLPDFLYRVDREQAAGVRQPGRRYVVQVGFGPPRLMPAMDLPSMMPLAPGDFVYRIGREQAAGVRQPGGGELIRTFGRGGLVRVVTTKGRTFWFPRGRLFPSSIRPYLRRLASVDWRQLAQTPQAEPPQAEPPQAEAPQAEETGTETVSPAQAAAIAMGRALQNNPFAPRELVNQLLAGQAPSPGYVTQQLVANLDPQLYKGLLGVAEAFGVLPEQFEQARRAFFVPGARVYVQRF